MGASMDCASDMVAFVYVLFQIATIEIKHEVCAFDTEEAHGAEPSGVIEPFKVAAIAKRMEVSLSGMR